MRAEPRMRLADLLQRRLDALGYGETGALGMRLRPPAAGRPGELRRDQLELVTERLDASEVAHRLGLRELLAEFAHAPAILILCFGVEHQSRVAEVAGDATLASDAETRLGHVAAAHQIDD